MRTGRTWLCVSAPSLIKSIRESTLQRRSEDGRREMKWQKRGTVSKVSAAQYHWVQYDGVWHNDLAVVASRPGETATPLQPEWSWVDTLMWTGWASSAWNRHRTIKGRFIVLHVFALWYLTVTIEDVDNVLQQRLTHHNPCCVNMFEFNSENQYPLLHRVALKTWQSKTVPQDH